jgi:hypothetical protein
MTITNPVQYSSRTFNSIMNDINSDAELVDKPNWWKRIWAGIGDVISMCLNAVANQSYLQTAYTEKAIDRLLQLIDYQRTGVTTSSGGVVFYISRTAAFPFTVALADMVAYSESSAVVSSKRFEADAATTFTAISETFTVTAGTDILAVASVYVTGDLVRLTTTDTLPAADGGGLSINTDYFVIYVSDTEIRLARTLALAYAGTYIDITDTGAGTHTAHRYSKVVTMSQKKTVYDYIAGASDGVTEWQEYVLPDLNIIKTTIAVTINSVLWTQVDTFAYSGVADTHYKVNSLTDGSTSIVFPNGVYGVIPGAFDIYVTYATGGGLYSNVSTIDKINAYGGSDSNITGVSNYEAFTGGADKESIESAKVLAPLLLKARDRFITVEDGEALVYKYGGVSLVKVVKNYYGALSCAVVIVPTGGGAPSAPFKAALQTYLIDRSVLESIDIRVVDPTYVATATSIGVHMLPGYDYADWEAIIKLAQRLLVSEFTYELQQYLISYGIANTVTYINTLFSTSFTSADYAEINNLVENAPACDFGKNIEESDFEAFLDGITGVDYITVTTPAAFPVTFGDLEISTVSTYATVEIP